MRSPDQPHWKMMVSDSFLQEFTGVQDLLSKDLQGIDVLAADIVYGVLVIYLVLLIARRCSFCTLE